MAKTLPKENWFWEIFLSASSDWRTVYLRRRDKNDHFCLFQGDQHERHGPAELTKNKATIEFSVRHNMLGCHDTIRWYLRVIRRLFPHAESSPFLFPAVTVPGAHLNADFFGAEFAALMRTVVNLPMTPHQMRHGQTSLLLDRYPNEIEVIAKRIDDTPQTLRQYYGWLNSLKLVERGQDLLLGLIND